MAGVPFFNVTGCCCFSRTPFFLRVKERGGILLFLEVGLFFPFFLLGKVGVGPPPIAKWKSVRKKENYHFHWGLLFPFLFFILSARRESRHIKRCQRFFFPSFYMGTMDGHAIKLGCQMYACKKVCVKSLDGTIPTQTAKKTLWFFFHCCGVEKKVFFCV